MILEKKYPFLAIGRQILGGFGVALGLWTGDYIFAAWMATLGFESTLERSLPLRILLLILLFGLIGRAIYQHANGLSIAMGVLTLVIVLCLLGKRKATSQPQSSITA